MNHSTIRESPSTRILGMILALVILALTLPISSAITEDAQKMKSRKESSRLMMFSSAWMELTEKENSCSSILSLLLAEKT